MKLRLLIIFALSLAFTVKIMADNPLIPEQTTNPFFLGPVVGVNVVSHSVDLPTFSWDNTCPRFSSGSKVGFFAGASFEYHIGEEGHSQSSIIARALYNSFPGHFEINGKMLPILVKGLPESSITLNTLDVSYNCVTFEVQYKFNPIPDVGFGIIAGPSFDFVMNSNSTQKFKLVEPLNAQFEINDSAISAINKKYGYKIKIVRYEDTHRTMVLYDDAITNATSLRVAAKVGVQYDINFQGFYIVPSACYNFALTKVTSDESWRINVIQLGIDVRFAINPGNWF